MLKLKIPMNIFQNSSNFINKTNLSQIPIMSITIYTDGACSGNPGIGGMGCSNYLKDADNTY